MAIRGVETINYEERARESEYKKRLHKVMTEKEAVETFLHDGDSLCLGGFVMWRQPESVLREIARQGKKNLSLIDESGDFEGIDLLVELGMLDRIDIAYCISRQVGGISGTPAIDRSIREGVPRPIEAGGVLVTPKDKLKSDVPPLKIVDWTNFTISLRFVAGALNVPFIPCHSSFGSDIPRYTREIKVINDPYENKPLLLIPATSPMLPSSPSREPTKEEMVRYGALEERTTGKQGQPSTWSCLPRNLLPPKRYVRTRD